MPTREVARGAAIASAGASALGTGLRVPRVVIRHILLHRYVLLMRPHQWTKNAIVLAGVAFSGRADEPAQLARALGAVLAFCLVSSAVYVFNDWHDRHEDRLHPVKQWRPIAARLVSPPAALAWSLVLLCASIGAALVVDQRVAAIVAIYALLMTAYTLVLRSVPVVDVLVIAFGFVLRALAGAEAVSVPLSSWLFVCTLLLALTLGLGKRRHELRMLGGETARHRPSLAGYASIPIDGVIVVAALLTAGAYLLYALAVPSFGRTLPMLVTVPFVLLALARYLHLVFGKNLGGTPEVLLVSDRPLFLSIVAWSAAVALVLIS